MRTVGDDNDVVVFHPTVPIKFSFLNDCLRCRFTQSLHCSVCTVSTVGNILCRLMSPHQMG